LKKTTQIRNYLPISQYILQVTNMLEILSKYSNLKYELHIRYLTIVMFTISSRLKHTCKRTAKKIRKVDTIINK
jgi:hypothetical protein